MIKPAQAPVYPEFIERDDDDAGAWDVSATSNPFTDIQRHKMGVLPGHDPHSRATRAQQLMRTKVSPAEGLPLAYDAHPLAPQVIDACESYRVNALLRHAGVKNNGDDIDNKSILHNVERLVINKDTNSLTDLIVRHHKTKVGSSISRAIKSYSDKHKVPEVNEFAKGLRKMVNGSASHWNEPYMRSYLADTRPHEIAAEYDDYEDEYYHMDVPSGYKYSMSLADRVATYLSRKGNLSPVGDKPKGGTDTEFGGVPDEFAELSVQKLPLPERVAGRMGRRRAATDIGINPRRAHRYYSDPERRIFDRRIKGIGGVVLIDQSGSMALSTEEIWEVIKASPGCTIIGYSHSQRAEYNCWILAENGRVVSEVREGNGGNGVDGPALLFALSKRKKGDPLIWVCDGLVTGRHDQFERHLAEWCAKVATAHNVHMVDTVPEAIDALKRVRAGHKLPLRLTGPVEDPSRW